MGQEGQVRRTVSVGIEKSAGHRAGRPDEKIVPEHHWRIGDTDAETRGRGDAGTNRSDKATRGLTSDTGTRRRGDTVTER